MDGLPDCEGYGGEETERFGEDGNQVGEGWYCG